MLHPFSPTRNPLLSAALALIIICSAGCVPSSDGEARSVTSEERTAPGVFSGTFKEAVELGLIQVKGQGLGTYKEIELAFENTSNQDLSISMEAGSYFQNPESGSQNLITLSATVIEVKKDGTTRTTLPSACTNAGLRVPGRQSGWALDGAPKELDLALRFYGKHEEKIGKFLAKKNPQELGTPEQRQAFLQVAIWTYLGDNPQDIINLLAQEVFHNDIQKAKNFFESVRADAAEIAEMMRNRDADALKAWLEAATEVAIERGKERLENATENARYRLNRLRSN
jgi:hypothetical protein